MLTLVIFEVALLLRCLKILSVVDLVYVNFAQLLQIVKQTLNELDALLCASERLCVVLSLTEDGAQLESEFALEAQSTVTLG